MTRRLLPLLAAIALLTFFASGAHPARADATVDSATVENGYPKQLLFKLTASAPVEIKEVTLSYLISGTGIRSAAKPEEFTAGTKVTVEIKVDANPNTNWIPVGNEITWHWELALADGTKTVTAPQSFIYLPTGREWKTAGNADFTVFYYGSRETLANRFLEAMAGVYQEHGKTLLKTNPPQKPVKLILMANGDELQEAEPSKGSTLDNSRVVVTCGFRPGSARDIILAAVSCGGSDPVDTVRHEFGHILNAAAGESTLVKLPVWVDEGLAVYAQESRDDYDAAFRSAIQGPRGLIPFRQMSAQISDQNLVILQYGQSYQMVKYLIDKYGEAKLNALLALTKKSTRFDEALKQTYNFDIAGFESEFTAAVNARPAPTAAPTARPQQQARPTTVPTAVPQVRDVVQPSSDGGGSSKVGVVLVGVAVMFTLFGIMAFLVVMFLQNQRRPPA